MTQMKKKKNQINIDDIHGQTSDSNEVVAEQLLDQGYGLWSEGEEGKPALIKLATSDSVVDRQKYVELMEEFGKDVVAEALSIIEHGLKPVSVVPRKISVKLVSGFLIKKGLLTMMGQLYNSCKLNIPRRVVTE